MVDLLDEIKEDLHQQRLEKLWNKYKIIPIGGAIAVIGFTGFNSWEKHSDKTEKVETSVKYSEATAIRLEDDKRLKILTDISKTGSEGYSILSKFKIASIATKKKDYTNAVKSYDEIANDNTIPQYYRDLAAAKAFFILTEYVKDDPSIESRYKLASKESNTWNFTSKMSMAMYLLEKDKTRAKAIIKLLSENAKTPRLTKNRAEQLLNSIK